MGGGAGDGCVVGGTVCGSGLNRTKGRTAAGHFGALGACVCALLAAASPGQEAQVCAVRLVYNQRHARALALSRDGPNI
jgi:hypothetical protein